MFYRPLSDGSVAVALLNTGDFSGPHNISVQFTDVSEHCITSVYHSIPQYTTVYHSISQYTTVYLSIPQYTTVYHSILQYTTVYHSIPQYIVKYDINFTTQTGLQSSFASVRDVLEQRDLGMFYKTFTALVNPSGVRLVKLIPTDAESKQDWL